MDTFRFCVVSTAMRGELVGMVSDRVKAFELVEQYNAKFGQGDAYIVGKDLVEDEDWLAEHGAI